MQVASFDKYAQDYDAHFTFSEIGKLQRAAVYDYLMPLLNKQKEILEINCGTGYDAVEISFKVKNILATDVSEKMIKIAKIKQEISKARNLKFETRPIQQLEQEMLNKDLVFSNFGGLNCLSPEDFKDFAERCKSYLSKGNELFFVIMGRKCIWERFYFAWKSDPEKAKRRMNKNGVNTIINNTGFKTWYYSPSELNQLFGNSFKTKKIKAIGLFVPPSYLNPFFKKKQWLLKILKAFDRVFCTFKFSADYADHYLIHLRKEL